MKKSNFSHKNSKKKNQLWDAREKNVLTIIGAFLFILAIGFYYFFSKEDIQKRNAYKIYIGTEVPDSMVCMVSGEVKHEAINPVEVNGKNYWGCCTRCIAKLTFNINNVQLTKDPISGALISKADAIIRLNPQNQRQAMFFESSETYLSYVKKFH